MQMLSKEHPRKKRELHSPSNFRSNRLGRVERVKSSNSHRSLKSPAVGWPHTVATARPGAVHLLRLSLQ